MTFFSVLLKNKDKELVIIAKNIFNSYHPEWEISSISNRKIIYEALRYYIITEKDYKHKIEGLNYDK